MAVKFQAMYFPLAHGTSVAPSGLLPSVLMRPDGSFVQGVSAFVRALHTKSLTAKCLADLPAECLQTSPWWPLGSAVSPHCHWCGVHRPSPRRSPMATRIASLLRSKPQFLTGIVDNQSPARGEVTAFNLALLMGSL